MNVDFIFKKIITLDDLSENLKYSIEYLENSVADDFFETICYKVSLNDEYLIAISKDFCGNYDLDKDIEIDFFRSKGSGLSMIKNIALLFQSVFITDKDEAQIKELVDSLYTKYQKKACSELGLFVGKHEELAIDKKSLKKLEDASRKRILEIENEKEHQKQRELYGDNYGLPF